MKSGLYLLEVLMSGEHNAEHKPEPGVALLMDRQSINVVKIDPALQLENDRVATLEGYVFHANEKGEVESIEKLTEERGMKEHERIFFALCYRLRKNLSPRDVVHLLDGVIHHKRCWYYLSKWDRLGFYDYGVTLDLGWFYPEELPPRYLEIVKEAET